MTLEKELETKAKMIGTTEVQTICCENTDEEAINFCHFLVRMVTNIFTLSIPLPSVSLTSNRDNLGSGLSVSATEM